MSWRPEVQTDASGQWYPNGMRFPTEAEAFNSAKDLSYRWFAVRAYRATESQDPPNYRYIAGSLVPYSKLAQSMLLDEQKGRVS